MFKIEDDLEASNVVVESSDAVITSSYLSG